MECARAKDAPEMARTHEGEGRGEGWQEHRVGSYQEVGREFTSRIIKFYDEESVFPFVSWPPSLLHGLLDIRIRNRLIIILHLTVCTFACLQIYLQWAPVDEQNEQQRGYARNARKVHEDEMYETVGHVTFLPDTLLLLEIKSNRRSNGCLRGYVR